MKISNTNAPGWTLIEIVVILIVAAIILPALIFPFIEGVRGLNMPVISGTLALLAQEEMEKKVVCLSYELVNGWASTPFSAPFGDYSSTCNIDPNASFGTINEGLMEITVTVTHIDGQTLSLVTVKSDWELQ
ncbi:MAG: hypothetical protein V1789_10450 [PVC group bacterium]